MAAEHEQDPEPALPPDAMSWERRVSQPPKLNDQTAALPFWARPFTKPEVEHLAATSAMPLVIAKLAAPYVFAVALVANALHGVPMRHMFFTVPATTIIGVLLMVTVGVAVQLLGRLSGYRAALVSFPTDDEHTDEALASALERAAAQRGFIVVWSKDHSFVATRNVEQAVRGLTARSIENGPRRLSLLSRHKKAPRVRTLKLETHGLCIWDTGEAEHIASLARSIVQDAAASEPWVAQSARWPGELKS
jgi:hypothetical protein